VAEPKSIAYQYKDSWCFYYNMDHYLYLKEGSKDQGIGLFARYGVSDGKANPIKYFASFGIGGKGMIPGRCQDTFGVGYYHVWFTDNLPSIVKRRLLNNEQGGELYYNIYLTPWVQLTPDLQIIDSGNKSVDNTVIVGGLRMQVNF
jgi:porin